MITGHAEYRVTDFYNYCRRKLDIVSKNKFEYFFFKLFVLIFSAMGINRARHAAGIVAALFFYLIPVRKQTVIDNLRMAFPDMTEKQIRKIAFGSYTSFAVSLIEIFCLPKLAPETIRNMVSFPDFKSVRDTYDQGRGLIVLTAHYGNWELGAMSIAAQLETSMSVVVKMQRNPYVSEWMNNMREKFGNKVVPLGVSIREIYKEIKNKHLVGMVADQRGPREAVRVKFFGRDTAIYTGPASLAVKTNVPVIVAILIRQKDYSYIAYTEEITSHHDEHCEEERVKAITQTYMSILEKYARQYPEHWLWMHKIWKY